MLELRFCSFDAKVITRSNPFEYGSLYKTLSGPMAKNHTKLKIKAFVVVIRLISDEERAPKGFLASYSMESVLSGQY